MLIDWSTVPTPGLGIGSERWTYAPTLPTKPPVCPVCGAELVAGVDVDAGRGLTVTISHPLPARAACLEALGPVLRTRA